MELSFEQICEKFIHEKTRSYACVVDIDNYDLLYMTDSLKDNMVKSERRKFTKCYETFYGLTAPCSFCTKNIVLNKKEHTWLQHYPERNEYYSVTDYLFENKNKAYFVHTAINITSEIETINSLKSDVKNFNTIIDCANVLISQHEPHTSIQELLKILCNFYDAEFAYLFERDYSINLSTCTYHYTTPKSTLNKSDFDFSFNLEYCPDWIQFMKPKKYAFIHAYDPEANIFPIKNHPISIRENCNYLFTPLNLNGITVGTICIANLRKNINNFQPVNEITAFVINSLALKYAANKLRSENEKNQLLLNCANTFVLNRNFENAINRILEIICLYFDARICLILEGNFDKDIVLPKYYYESSEDEKVSVSGKVSFSAMGKWNKALSTDGVAYVKNLKKDLASNYIEDTKQKATYSALLSKNITSFAMAPLHGRTKEIGFVWVENPKKNIPNLSILETISTFIVNHMSRDELLKKYEHLSFTDKLTGIKNRNAYILFLETLKHTEHSHLGILYCDVNGLKFVNDHLGHNYGDLLIKFSSTFLIKQPTENVFRTGGDEFVCIFENISKLDFNTLVMTIQETLCTMQENLISIGASWAQSTSNIEELISTADKNMYKVKQKYYRDYKKDTRSDAEKLNSIKEVLSHSQLV